LPTITPYPEESHFTYLGFSAEPYGGDDTAFPTGIEEIFAHWAYAGMREGMTVRREWIHNGTVWVEQEDAWDFAAYGSNGYLYDISIFDQIDGLPDGEWTLNLYVDGVRQAGLGDRFIIADLQEMVRLSPDESRTAWIANWRELSVDGRTVFETGYRLNGLSWFPDNRHIAFSEILPGSPVSEPGPPGPRYRLWQVDLNSGEATLMGDVDAFFQRPAVSPDGRWLAVVVGNGYGDACFSGLGLAFLPLSADLTPGEPLFVSSFTGFAPVGFEDVYPVNGLDFASPGYWESAETFIAALAFTCAPEGSEGLYRVQVDDRRVEYSGPLEE
jgi:hypothetical protein